MMQRITWKLLILVLFIAACQPAVQTPFAATVPPNKSLVPVAQKATVVPTARPFATHTFTPSPTATFTITPTASDTFTPTMTFTPSMTPTLEKRDHYVLRRPISEEKTDWADRTYPYGWTQYGEREVHHGMEFVNPRFTPVFAAADGVVIYAGHDRETMFGPYPDYYGNLVVVDHGVISPEGMPVYTLYAHLQRFDVEEGETVSQGDQLGAVGDTGVAVGPHLHFEVRVGSAEDYGATRNPDLWLLPFPRYGTLAGQIMDKDGQLEMSAVIKVRSSDALHYAFSYADDSVNSDAVWNENYTLGDLPVGQYAVIISDEHGRIYFQEHVTIESGQTTWLDIQLEESPDSE